MGVRKVLKNPISITYENQETEVFKNIKEEE
jgi:hypothetical protein